MRTHLFPIFVALNPDYPKPFTAPAPDRNSVFVFLAEDEEVISNNERVTFQLAHEAVHCLEPSKFGAPQIEEGVATLFSLTATGISTEYARRAEDTLPDNYRDALADVRSLLNRNQQSISSIRTRASFRNVTPDLLRDAFGVPADLAERLCTVVAN